MYPTGNGMYAGFQFISTVPAYICHFSSPLAFSSHALHFPDMCEQMLLSPLSILIWLSLGSFPLGS